MTDAVLIVDPGPDGVVRLTLNRPDKRNALDTVLRDTLTATLGKLAADDGCRVVVLAGAGPAFCAGFDLAEIAAADDPAAIFVGADAYHHAVHTFPKPIVAAVHGPAVAGGLDLAVMCDVRLAGAGARFGQPQVHQGVPATYELLRTVVADPVARELCLTGRVIDATEAAAVGLVTRVVDGDVLAAATEVATTVAGVSSAAAMKAQFVAAQPELFGSGSSS